jgi:hypothetical protein
VETRYVSDNSCNTASSEYSHCRQLTSLSAYKDMDQLSLVVKARSCVLTIRSKFTMDKVSCLLEQKLINT